MPKKNNPREYDRILEILDDYWIYEPNEYAVSVEMKFVKANGEYQVKCRERGGDVNEYHIQILTGVTPRTVPPSHT